MGSGIGRKAVLGGRRYWEGRGRYGGDDCTENIRLSADRLLATIGELETATPIVILAAISGAPPDGRCALLSSDID